ncbi:MAG: HAD-IIA family hydrolase [Candidatus Cloacimonetes bacterium]|nr:HAD-IIA family hydrolase [Candidatus Cloacimonadota bacterium]
MQGLIFDVDGTISIDNKLIKGTVDFFAQLDKCGIPYVFVSNTTSRTPAKMMEKLNSQGLHLNENQIITPITTAKQYLRDNGYRKIALVRCEATEVEFGEFEFSDDPEVVILTDDGEGLTYDDINRCFNYHLKGAKITALQKNKYYAKDNHLVADLGFYTAGFEYLTGEEILNFGKPSEALFRKALATLNIRDFNQVFMVGDDIEFDVLGAMKLGMKGVLVKTGKYQKDMEKKYTNQPDFILEDVTKLVRIPEVSQLLEDK